MVPGSKYLTSDMQCEGHVVGCCATMMGCVGSLMFHITSGCVGLTSRIIHALPIIIYFKMLLFLGTTCIAVQITCKLYFGIDTMFDVAFESFDLSSFLPWWLARLSMSSFMNNSLSNTAASVPVQTQSTDLLAIGPTLSAATLVLQHCPKLVSQLGPAGLIVSGGMAMHYQMR